MTPRELVNAAKKEDGNGWYPFCHCYLLYVKIYTLSDKHGNVFYVGCTSQPLKARLAGHIAKFSQPQSLPNQKKINKIIELNYEVSINLIEEKFISINKRRYAPEKMRPRELFWIGHYSKKGVDLCNSKRDLRLAA